MHTRAPGPLEKDTCRDYVLPALLAAGWASEQIVEQRYFTDGRIIPTATGHRRNEGKRTDYLLEIQPDLPVAVVEAKREYKLPGDGLQQAMRYAEILGIGYAYSSNGKGIVEHDYDTGLQRDLTTFPSPSELWARHRHWRGATDEAAAAVTVPFNRELRNPDGAIKRPRYYQALAINRAVQAAVDGRKRMLLTMATGTGKTFVALQVVWKLWERRWPEGRRPRVLYLADRNILVDQPITREFRPVFGEAVWKIQGATNTSREVYFALYQALADTTDDLGVLQEYPSDFFDLVIVDECHRGSARDGSSWRQVLDHFSPAIQLGMTATPLRDDNVDTYAYFGEPLYTYSLAQGIDDGFLAPYRVRRVLLSPDAVGWSPAANELDRYGRDIPPGLYQTRDFERMVSLLKRTRAAAEYLTNYLRQTDRFAKTIVFCVDQEHAEQMRSALHEANADLARQFPHYVARIVADEGDVGQEYLGDFVDPERQTPVIVTTSRLLSTGVDIPTCRNIVLFRPVGSIVEFKQIIGRGTRLFPDQDKLSFQIIDFTGATAVFADPAFDGQPEAVTQEFVDAAGTTREAHATAEVAAELETPAPEIPSPMDLEARAMRKLYVDDSVVYLTSESAYILDSTTGQLRVVEYVDFAAEQVRRLYPHADDLRSRWRSAGGRDQVVAALDSRGLDLGELAERAGLVETDPFDLLVHVAWNAPLRTRRERVNRLRQEHHDFLERAAPHARAVLETLLDKYAEHGISQIDDLASLEVPPLSNIGTPVEIARLFGGSDAFHEAVRLLGDFLYAA